MSGTEGATVETLTAAAAFVGAVGSVAAAVGAFLVNAESTGPHLAADVGDRPQQRSVAGD